MLKLSNWLKYLALTVLLVIPLYPKFPLFGVGGTYVSIRAEDFLMAIVMLGVGVAILKNFKAWITDPITVALIIFWAVGLLSVLSGVFITQTTPLQLGFLHWGRRIEYMAAFFLGLYAVKSKVDVTFFVKCILVVITYVFIFGLGQKYLYWPVISTQNYEVSKGVAQRYTPGAHLASTFAGHYDLATFIVFVSPVLIAYLLRKETKKWEKVAIALGLSMSFWLLVSSISRISLVAFMLGVALTLYLIRKWKLIPVVVILTVVLASTSPGVIARYGRVIEVTVKSLQGIKDRIILAPIKEAYAATAAELPQRRAPSSPIPISIPIFEDRSSSIRFNVEWPRAIRALTKNPLLGTGYSSITLATDNDYLRALGETGILGFGAFMLVLARLFFTLWRARRNVYVAGIIGGMAGILLNAVFIDVFEASKFAIVFWLLAGMAVSIARGENAKAS